MIIGIDGNEANVENRVGVNTYAYEVLWGLYRENKHKLIVYLREKPLPHLPPQRDNFRYTVIPGGGQWIIKKLMPHLYRTVDKPDVFFAPSHYVPPFAPMPRVCSIMDLGYLEFSGQFKKYDYWQLKLWSAWSIFWSEKILAISAATKKDIVRHYGFARKKVTVTPLAYDKTKFNSTTLTKDVRRVKNKYTIVCERYLLFLSTLKPSKNVEGLILAWAKIEKDYPETQLIIAGRKGWLYEKIFAQVERLQLQERVVFTDFIDEEDKPALIQGAYAFVLPSFWEGFGLDVLNAFGAGTPVIVSDRGSLPEVAGEAGLIVNPDSTDDIAAKMRTMLEMKKADYEKLVKKGFKQAEKFDWDKTARKTLEVLESTHSS